MIVSRNKDNKQLNKDFDKRILENIVIILEGEIYGRLRII